MQLSRSSQQPNSNHQSKTHSTLRAVETSRADVCLFSKIWCCTVGTFTAEIPSTTQLVWRHKAPLITDHATSTSPTIWYVIHASPVVECSRRALELFCILGTFRTIMTLYAEVLSIGDDWAICIITIEARRADSAGCLCCLILVIPCITGYRIWAALWTFVTTRTLMLYGIFRSASTIVTWCTQICRNRQPTSTTVPPRSTVLTVSDIPTEGNDVENLFKQGM